MSRVRREVTAPRCVTRIEALMQCLGPVVRIGAGAPMGTACWNGVAARDGRGVSALAFSDHGTWRVAHRIDAPAPAVADVAARLHGVLRCEEAQITLRFQNAGEALSAHRIDGPERLVGRASPIAPGVLCGWLDEIPRHGLLWRFDPEAAKVDQLIWNTLRVRRLVFERIA